MVTSACAAEWLDGHRYFNSFTSSTTASTTIEMASPSLSGSNASFTFTVTDPDSLHQAHFFTTRYDTYSFDDLSLLDCKSFDGTSTTATATFTTSTLTFDNDSVTLRVMDATGSMTEKLFSVNVTALFADVNGDGIIDITDLTEIAGKIGQTGEDRADVNRDGVVDNTDLTLAAGVFGSPITSAPSVSVEELEGLLTKANLQKWLHDARQMNLKDPVSSAVSGTGTTPLRIDDTDRDTSIAELSEPLQPGDMDTVPISETLRCYRLHLFCWWKTGADAKVGASTCGHL